MAYDPPRHSQPMPPKDPLEIELVFNVRSCGTCRFFWPENPKAQPYGPYSSYDFNSNTPAEKGPEDKTKSFVWIEGTTRAPSFPDAEVMDGCRKAPIMTIGINPNLTAFGPGPIGASWCYPSFSSENGTDSWTKYAYYYRYRSVYQEHLDVAFAEEFLLPDGRITAVKPGRLIECARLSDDPSYEMRVQYDGEASPTAVHLPGKHGDAPYVVLLNEDEQFKQGQLLAGRIDVPGGHTTKIYAQPISYYTQMLPVLEQFGAYLKKKGHADADLRVGEDVGQLDMVACATPHWGPEWLGGTSQSVNRIVSTCVHKNAWAMKQLIHTRPAVLFLVGQASWNMFRRSFGHVVRSPEPLPAIPEDGPYTLLRLTTKQAHRIVFSTNIGGSKYKIATRMIITPHFSYKENFVPQFRMAPEAFEAFSHRFPDAVRFLEHDARIQLERPPAGYVAAGLQKDVSTTLKEIKRRFPTAFRTLMATFYDPHRMMSNVLKQLYDQGELAYTPASNDHSGFLTRSVGPCSFCDNRHWRFPKGCPYGKPEEKQYRPGFLEKVTHMMLARA